MEVWKQATTSAGGRGRRTHSKRTMLDWLEPTVSSCSRRPMACPQHTITFVAYLSGFPVYTPFLSPPHTVYQRACAARASAVGEQQASSRIDTPRRIEGPYPP